MADQTARALSAHSVVTAAGAQLSCDLAASEVVILNLADGVYYGLDDVGARVWTLLQERRTVASIRDAIVREYAVDASTCERDLLALLSELADHDLIVVHNAPAS